MPQPPCNRTGEEKTHVFSVKTDGELKRPGEAIPDHRSLGEKALTAAALVFYVLFSL